MLLQAQFFFYPNFLNKPWESVQIWVNNTGRGAILTNTIWDACSSFNTNIYTIFLSPFLNRQGWKLLVYFNSFLTYITANQWSLGTELWTHNMLKDPGHKQTQNSQLSAITDPWHTTHLHGKHFMPYSMPAYTAGAQLSITSVYLLINTQTQAKTLYDSIPSNFKTVWHRIESTVL